MKERILSQEEIDKIIEDLKSPKTTGTKKVEKLNKLIGISHLLLREQIILEKEIRKQKRLRVIRISIGITIGFIVSILIYYRILSY